MMNHITSAQAVTVWFFLIGATLCTGWVAEHHGVAGQFTVLLVMLVAAFKSLALLLYYMEIKSASREWLIAFMLWVFIVTSLILLVWFIR